MKLVVSLVIMKNEQITIPTCRGLNYYDNDKSYFPFTCSEFYLQNEKKNLGRLFSNFWCDTIQSKQMSEMVEMSTLLAGEYAEYNQSMRFIHQVAGVVPCFFSGDTAVFGSRKQNNHNVLTMNGAVALFPGVKVTDKEFVEKFLAAIECPERARVVNLGQILLPSAKGCVNDFGQEQFCFDAIKCYQYRNKFYGLYETKVRHHQYVYHNKEVYQLNPLVVEKYMDNGFISKNILFSASRKGLEKGLNETFLPSFVAVNAAISKLKKSKLSKCVIEKNWQKSVDIAKISV